jgi:phage shock protein PspC (stress-responsive transcriptional regulator)
MEKNILIQIGGNSFQISENAYKLLEKYLNDIKHQFKNIDEQNEIISDIEYRIAEIFSLELKNHSKNSIGEFEVEKVIKLLGDPNVISGSDEIQGENEGREENEIGNNENDKRYKKLYRYPNDKIIGGICSGLSMYLGIYDPIWMRILFILLFFLTGGITLIMYLIGLIIIPEAKNSNDFRKLKGESLDLKSIQNSFESVRNELNSENTNQKLHSFFRILAKIIQFIIGVIMLFVLIIFILFLFGLFFDNLTINAIQINQIALLNYFFENDLKSLIFLISLFLVCFLPLVFISNFIFKMLFKMNLLQNKLKFILNGVWLFLFFILIFLIYDLFKEFKYTGQKEEIIYTTNSKDKTFYIKTNDSLTFELIDNHIILNNKILEKGQLALPFVEFNVNPTNDSIMSIVQIKMSKGKKEILAQKNVEFIDAKYEIKKDTLFFENFFQISKPFAKFRNQKVIYNLNIPIGYKVHLNSSLIDLNHFIDIEDGEIEVKDKKNNFAADQDLIMTKEGLKPL